MQPILDRHCLPCHGYRERRGGVLLGGDLGPEWSHAYFTLLATEQVADGHNGLGNKPPRSLGSSASPLLQKVDGSHHKVAVTPAEWRTLWLWIESGAPFAGSYAALRNEEQQQRAGAAMGEIMRGAFPVINRRCASCHHSTELADGRPKRLPYDPAMREERRPIAGRPTAEHERIVFPNDPIALYSRNVLVNLSRPELSPLLLAPLAPEAGGRGACGPVFASTNAPGYQAILAAVGRGKAIIETEPRYGAEDFRPNRQYLRELQRFAVLPVETPAEAPAPLDVFALDQAYWRKLWPSSGTPP
ncbi:MAG: hypothetical protein H7A45_15645 [Verrucomicrobiales bacterium]|nr:hypothetical protein [Verrucomicrobiales bacterium]